MVATNEEGKSELVIRIRAKNGNDCLDVTDIAQAVFDREGDKFIVQEIEGSSLEAEILASTARQIIKKHIVDPLSEIPLKMVRDINDAWQEVKEKVEPLLQGRFATCPACGSHALSAPLSDGVKFVCPHCEEKLFWRFKVDSAHPEGGRYVLER